MTLRKFTSPVNPDCLARELSARLTAPIAVVTMGNPWRGDDAAAIRVGELLGESDQLMLFNTETAPESFVMPIATCGAASCLLVDTVAAGASPGDVLVLDAEDLQHTDFSTHGLSPKAFLEAVAGLSKMNIAILGIQPGEVREGETLSPVVQHSVDSVVSALQRLTAT